jgi:hypothetical protein
LVELDAFVDGVGGARYDDGDDDEGENVEEKALFPVVELARDLVLVRVEPLAAVQQVVGADDAPLVPLVPVGRLVRGVPPWG